MFNYLKKINSITSSGKISLLFIILISLLISISEIMSLGIFQSIILSIFETNIVIENNFLKNIKVFFYSNFDDPLKLMLLFFVIFYSLKNVTAILLNFIFFRFIEKQHHFLNKKFFDIFMQTQYLELSKNKNTFYNQVLSRYIENFIKSVYGSIIKISTEILFITIIFIYLLSINFKLVFFTILILSFLILIYNSTIKKFLKKNSENISKTEEIIKFSIYEYIKNFREIYLYKLKNNFKEKFYNNSKLFVKYERKFLFLGSITKYVFEIIIISFLCFYMVSLLDKGKITYELSSLITMSFALLKLMPSFNIINHCLIQINQHNYSVKILENFLKNYKQTEMNFNFVSKNNNQNLDKIIIKDLSFSYENKKKIFNNLNFECSIGDLILIKGISGSGKSTFLDVLSSIIITDNKNILFFDRQNKLIQNFDNFAYVGQQPNLFNGTLRHNLLLNNKSIEDKLLINIVNEVDLNLDCESDKILDYKIQEDGENLSGGQKQKLSLARALVQNKTVLLLDEITSGLDKESEKNVLNILEKIKTNKIIFFISHKTSIKFDKLLEFKK